MSTVFSHFFHKCIGCDTAQITGNSTKWEKSDFRIARALRCANTAKSSKQFMFAGKKLSRFTFLSLVRASRGTYLTWPLSRFRFVFYSSRVVCVPYHLCNESTLYSICSVQCASEASVDLSHSLNVRWTSVWNGKIVRCSKRELKSEINMQFIHRSEHETHWECRQRWHLTSFTVSCVLLSQ